MNVLLVLIIAAILHASWNAFVKDQNNGLVTVTIISSAMACIALPLTFIVGLPSSEIWIYLGISTLAHTLYMHSMTRAYVLYDFSIAYPFARGLAPLLTTLILVFFFQRSSKSHRVTRNIINCRCNFSAFTKSNYQD
jgi:hypothetical protein